MQCSKRIDKIVGTFLQIERLLKDPVSTVSEVKLIKSCRPSRGREFASGTVHSRIKETASRPVSHVYCSSFSNPRRLSPFELTAPRLFVVRKGNEQPLVQTLHTFCKRAACINIWRGNVPIFF